VSNLGPIEKPDIIIGNRWLRFERVGQCWTPITPGSGHITKPICNLVKGVSALDIPRIFNITESAHRIHNPFTPEKLATLGVVLAWNRGLVCSTSQRFGRDAVHLGTRSRNNRRRHRHEPVVHRARRNSALKNSGSPIESSSPTATLSATSPTKRSCGSLSRCHVDRWGVVGTIELSKSLRTKESSHRRAYWLPVTTDGRRCHEMPCHSDLRLSPALPELLASFWATSTTDVVEMVLATEGRDTVRGGQVAHHAPMARANPDDDFAEDVRAKLTLGTKTLRRVHA